MKQHYQDIYDLHPHRYDRLVACEDPAGALLATLRRVCVPAGATIVEAGAGTGRVTRLLAPSARRIYAFDGAPAMLRVARQRLVGDGLRNVHLAVADHRRLPLRSGGADLAVEGWAFGHLLDAPEGWQVAVDAALGELRRSVRPGGSVVLIETLGTGAVEPAAPSAALATLYGYLEDLGFVGTWCRTDYEFRSVEEAEGLVRFFFGAPLAEQVLASGSTTLPECTGVWSLRVPGL